MSDDAVAQFMAITSAEAETAQQYLQAADFSLEQAIELYFASGGASVESQREPEVRDRIEGFDDQLVDEEAQLYNEAMRSMRRNEARHRRPRGVFNQSRDEDMDNSAMSRHERRLAELFRPPFDIMTDLPLDEARELAQSEHKFVLVNVQDQGEFSCQRLNRDLWRSQAVKQAVSTNFVFLQYDSEDPDGEDYCVLYPFEGYPHIAIIDPWTGEQMRVWNKVPAHDEFIEDLYDFVSEHAGILEAAGQNAEDAESDPLADESNSVSDMASVQTADAAAAPTAAGSAAEAAPVDPIEAISADTSDEPPAGADTTRIQLRYGDGKRTVRRFRLSDPVSTIYGVAKHVTGENKLTLTADRRDLSTQLDTSIDEANLKNSTVLVELA